MTPHDAYGLLLERWKEAHLVMTAAAVLEWDQQTGMPELGGEHRAAQLALLAGIHHERTTDSQIESLLGIVEGSQVVEDAESVESANVREIRRAYDREIKLPKSLVEEWARTTARAQQEWAAARQAKDFSRFAPWLSKVFKLAREKTNAIDSQSPPYDVLLDDYEQGAKADDIAVVFRQLRDALIPMVGEIVGSSKQPDESILHRHYPIDRQQFFGEMSASEIGFDFQRGRLDVTTHPFCTTLGPHDCRILTRYNPRFFNESFFGTLHEAGHGLYEQGLDPERFGTPTGEAVSLGVHESQSRLWENQVGRSREYWQRSFPRARGLFREALKNVDAEAFTFAVNKVSPSFIRVEADELTYNLHILIRFELEQALLAEDLSIEGLPAAWNEKYKHYLGIVPPDDALGCLQDVHWSAGLIGYFPTYTLGNIYAAQIRTRIDEELGGFGELVMRGEFQTILGWLRTHIHQHGKRFAPRELIKRATHLTPSADPLIESLREKFAPLYR